MGYVFIIILAIAGCWGLNSLFESITNPKPRNNDKPKEDEFERKSSSSSSYSSSTSNTFRKDNEERSKQWSNNSNSGSYNTDSSYNQSNNKVYSQRPKGSFGFGDPGIDRSGQIVRRGFFSDKRLKGLDEATEATVNGFVTYVYACALSTLDDCDPKLLSLITHDVCKKVLGFSTYYTHLSFASKSSSLAAFGNLGFINYNRPIRIPDMVIPKGEAPINYLKNYRSDFLSLMIYCETNEQFYESLNGQSPRELIPFFKRIINEQIVVIERRQLLMLTVNALRLIFDDYEVKPNLETLKVISALFIDVFDLSETYVMRILGEFLDLSEATKDLERADPEALKQAYCTLECNPSDDMDTIRRQKRKLLNYWHPDRASESNVEEHTLRSQKINEAFDLIEKERKLDSSN